MSEPTPDFPDSEPQEIPIQVDVYGVKVSVNVQPGAADDPPQNWREVWQRVNLSLMRLATDAPGFVADLFSCGRVLLRGVASIPAAIGKRIEGAHRRVEEQEAEAQSVPLVEGGDCTEEVQAALDRLRAKGVCAEVHRLPGGGIAIIAVRPDQREAALELAQDAVPDDPATGFPSEVVLTPKLKGGVTGEFNSELSPPKSG